MGDTSDVESVDNSKSGDSVGSKANKNGGKVKKVAKKKNQRGERCPRDGAS
jgi:hypothetical protein